MYVNAKMIPVETVPGIGRGGMKESSWGGDSGVIVIDLIYCKNLCKYSNVPPLSTTIIKIK
jgi:hypothetical protein